MKSQNAEISCRTPGRPREFDMNSALDCAVRVFGERGYHATSIIDLTEAMGLTAGSIYKAFKDKRAVFIAALERQMTRRSVELQAALDLAESGRSKVRAALAFYADASHGVEGRLGCLVVGTAMELTAFDSEIAERVTGSFRAREKLIADLIRMGQADASIVASIEIKATARCLLCLMQGLRVMGKTAPARNDMSAAVDVAMKMLD
jgi:TetR/AcrR family transcriptional repressor of nem operon